MDSLQQRVGKHLFHNVVLSIRYESPIGRFAPREQNILRGLAGGQP
jgi:hypothetical protein